MGDGLSDWITRHSAARGAVFPGSAQVQQRPWSQASLRAMRRDGSDGSPKDTFDQVFLLTANHSDFDPEWPIVTDWPAVARGLRGAMALTQAEYAELLGLGRATVERWETGKSVPFGGEALEMLSLVRPHLGSPLQAGQALNLAAAVVLPHITQPTAEYSGYALADFLVSGKHNHRDLAPALLSALTESRILVAIEGNGDELDDTYFPLAARLRPDSSLPAWAERLIETVQGLSGRDRQLVITLADRLRHLGETSL